MGKNIIQLTEQNFNQATEAKEPVLVDFWAEWCGPCKRMAPVVDEIAKEYSGKVKVFKVNVDGAQDTAAKYQVMSIPTLLFMKGGQVIDRVVGAVPKSAIDEKLKQML